MTCPRKISLLELCLLNNMIIIFMIFCQKSAIQVVDWAIANPEGQVAYYVLLIATLECASFLELQNHLKIMFVNLFLLRFCFAFSFEFFQSRSCQESIGQWISFKIQSTSCIFHVFRLKFGSYYSNIFFHNFVKTCKKLWENNTTCTKNPRAK